MLTLCGQKVDFTSHRRSAFHIHSYKHFHNVTIHTSKHGKERNIIILPEDFPPIVILFFSMTPVDRYVLSAQGSAQEREEVEAVGCFGKLPSPPRSLSSFHTTKDWQERDGEALSLIYSSPVFVSPFPSRDAGRMNENIECEKEDNDERWTGNYDRNVGVQFHYRCYLQCNQKCFLKMGILLCIHHLSLRYIYKAPRQLTSTRVKCWAGS